jgi:transitional endoplasmic reticulum ATPase
MLIVDEAETMFWDRAKSERSWEASKVNEFLAALETHPLPIAFTTNHLERIDPAIIRRLTFKVKFDLLTKDQRATAFARFFGGDTPARVHDLEGLALGDFVTARKKATVLGIAQEDANAIVGLLEVELAAKPHAARRIGF